jgi:hypothetical protein
MRRLSILLVVASTLPAAAITGCGSSSSGPVNTELSYFPPNSPFVMSIVTDPNSSAVKGGQALAHRFGACFAPAPE